VFNDYNELYIKYNMACEDSECYSWLGSPTSSVQDDSPTALNLVFNVLSVTVVLGYFNINAESNHSSG
jgi:hypothetical protein